MSDEMNYTSKGVGNAGLALGIIGTALGAKYGSSAEKVLVAICNAKAKCHTAAAEDIKRVKDENAVLQKQLKELEDLINAK